MVMTVLLTNNARSTLLSGINALQTEIRLRAGGGNTLPTITAPGQWFPITIEDSLGNIEIMRVIARSGDVLTVKRAQEGTTAKSFSANDVVELRLTVGAMQELVSDTHTNFGRIYMTPADGVDSKIGVPAGYYFNVRSPSDDSYVDEYQNVNGVAVATGKSYPSGALTQAMSEQIDKIGSLDYLSEQLDQIAVDKGWDASFVVDGHETQKEINETRTIVKSSVFELITLNQNQIKPKALYKTKAFYDGNNYGSAFYYWDSTKSKLDANGGTIIDPANTGGFDGTYTTIESFLSAQGAGLGTGCWVCTSSKADTTRFGLHKSYDISAPLQKAIEYAKADRSSGVVTLPSGLLILAKKVSADFSATTATAITLRGAGPQTQIMSSVIGDNAIEFADPSNCVIEDFALYGVGGQSGTSGDGHGIALIPSTGQAESLPNGCIVKNIIVRNFRGTARDVDGNAIGAAGVYFGGGTVNILDRITTAYCQHGIYLDKVGPIKVSNAVGASNVHSTIIAIEPGRYIDIESPNMVGGAKSTAPVVWNGATIGSAAIVVYNTLATININNMRVKGECTHLRFISTRKAVVSGGNFMLPDTGLPAIVSEVGSASCDLTVKDLIMHSTVPQSGGHKAILVQSPQAGYRTAVKLDNIRFHIAGQWDYALRIENSVSTDRTKFTINDCFVFGDGSNNATILNSLVHVENGRVFGALTNNYFTMRSQAVGSALVDFVTTNNTRPQELETKGNTTLFVNASQIINPLRESSARGYGTYTTTSPGVLYIPVNLNSAPIHVAGQVSLGSTELNLIPNALSNQTKDMLRFLVIDSGGANYSGDVTLYYEARTLP